MKKEKERQISLLDCTLRDGGYVNDWEFGYDNIVTMFERIVSSRVEMIEVGFLDERRVFDINRSIMPDSNSVQKIYGMLDSKQTMVVAMIDYGTCGIEHLTKCEDSYIDGIRVIFKKHNMHEALNFCGEVKALGYKVFVQLVSITSYTDDDLMEMVERVNTLKPYAISMVDTYGLLHQDSLRHYFEVLDEHVISEVKIGYHSHNNFQLGYANCIEMLQADMKHDIIIDATLYGMGKSAGNAPIELVAMHLNERYGKAYDINQMLEAIDGNVMQIYQKHPWGYNLFFYLSASNNCHPNYVQFLLDKHTLSLKAVNEILSNIEYEKKLLYDQAHIEMLYYEYQKRECDDTNAFQKLKAELRGRKLLLLGPGKNIQRQEQQIKAYIEKNEPIVISVNFIPDAFSVNYVFLCNARRYIRLNNMLRSEKNKNVKVIATSNVTEASTGFQYILNNEELLDKKADIVDNSFVMLLKVMKKLEIASLDCAGFDGYSEKEDNYFDSKMEYWFSRRKAENLNSYVKEFLKTSSDSLKVQFITDSYYTT